MSARMSKVTCVDGTQDIVGGAEAPCINNGGERNPKEQKSKTLMNVGVIAVVLIAGYFAYKKFKK